MTGNASSSDPLAMRRRRARYRAWHRGTKEMDLIMGRFADEMLEQMNEAELDHFDSLIELGDQELLSWIIGTVPLPASQENPLLAQLIAFHRG